MKDFYEDQYEKTRAKLDKQYEKQGGIIAICKAGLGMTNPYFKRDQEDALREILKMAKEDW